MRLRIALVSAALFVVAWAQARSLQPRTETGVLPIDPPTPFYRYLPDAASKGRVLVGHGLDASKEVMQILSAALADGGFEVYAIDLPGHGDSAVPFEATRAQRALEKAYEHLGADTIVIGHSLTAGLLLDLSSSLHFGTLVLLSPPPTPVSQMRADRALIVSGGLDAPRISGFGSIAADIGGLQAEYWELSLAGHSGAIFHPLYIRNIVAWAGGDGGKTRTIRRFFWIGLMFISSIAAGAALMPARGKFDPLHVRVPTVLVRYVAACGIAVLALRFFVPLAFIRLFAMDYLVSFLFLTGLVLWIQHRAALRIDPPAIAKAAAAAAFVIAAIGFGAASHMLHMSLSAGRWWRFPIIAAAGLLLLSFDEIMIRRISPRWKAAAVAVTTRLLLWAFLLSGVLLLNRQDAFLVLLAHLIVSFWVFLWLATEIVYRHTRDPLASALFAALVQGWAFAAWFVTL